MLHRLFRRDSQLIFKRIIWVEGNAKREEVVTYVLDGLISSIFLKNGCCVGVAADTDTVGELMMKQRRSITSSYVHG
jgi:uncharacterized Fe-S cluster-containing protein